MAEPRWLVDGYEEWVQQQGVPVASGLAVDLMTVETAHWDRIDAAAAFVHLDARGDNCSLYVSEILPGRSLAELRHLYECVVYVLDGNGSTVITFDDGTKLSFEWGRGSLFPIPLNAKYRHHNTSGNRSVRLANFTNLPLITKVFRDDAFIFDTPYDFPGRRGSEDSFRGEGSLTEIREMRHLWETNFVPDLLLFDKLLESPGRGRGSTSIHYVMADATMHSHASEIPAGDYKKAHRHGEGFHIVQLSGEGYSLYWREGEEPVKVDWTYGLAHSPAEGVWHQHFNVGDTPARYMAGAYGNVRYPFTGRQMKRREGGEEGVDQIEYEDEDPTIRCDFEAARRAFQQRASDAGPMAG